MPSFNFNVHYWVTYIRTKKYLSIDHVKLLKEGKKSLVIHAGNGIIGVCQYAALVENE